MEFYGNEGHKLFFMQCIETQDATVWNHWRQNNPQTNPDLNGIKIIGKSIPMLNLSYATLKDAELTESEISSIDFSSSDLTNTSFYGCELVTTNFSDALLKNTHFVNSNMDSVIFKRAKLIQTQLNMTSLRYADFSDAIMHSASFDEVQAYAINIQGADLCDEFGENAVALHGVNLQNSTGFPNMATKEQMRFIMALRTAYAIYSGI